MNRHERRKARTRAALIAATRDSLVDVGYESLTVQQITDRADVARATFYVHFEDKEVAVWAVLQTHVEGLMSALQEVGDLHEPGSRHAKWVRMFAFAREHRGLFDVVLSERGHIRLRRAMARFMRAALIGDISSGRIPRRAESLPVEFEATFYAGAVLELMTWWIREDVPLTPEQMAQHLGTLVLGEPEGGGLT